jgi:hypothetical protein
MAHFVKPPGAPAEGYGIDNAQAPGSVWRLAIPAGARRDIGLWGGSGLWVRSTDSGIVPFDDYNERAVGDLRVFSLFGAAEGSCDLEVGQGRSKWLTLRLVVTPRVSAGPHVFIVRDVRLAGYKPRGDCLEVDQSTPLRWIIDNIKDRAAKNPGNLKVIFMAHGLPGYIQCGLGAFTHPTAGPGITVADLNLFDEIRGSAEQLSIYSCLVARIGTCPECDGHVGYDGNQLCFMLAQRTQAKVKASIHLQYYFDGTVGAWIFKRPNGQGITFGQWNGTVFTWGPTGAILYRETFPYVTDSSPSGDPESDRY